MSYVNQYTAHEVPKILVGSKCDKPGSRVRLAAAVHPLRFRSVQEVSDEEVEAMAAKHNATFFGVSAKV